MNQKKMKRCTSRVQELISAEELVSLFNLKAEIERKENRRNRRKSRYFKKQFYKYYLYRWRNSIINKTRTYKKNYKQNL